MRRLEERRRVDVAGIGHGIRAPYRNWGTRVWHGWEGIARVPHTWSERPGEGRSWLHVLVHLVVEDVGREQDHDLLSRVLPPMRRRGGLAGDLAGLVHDGHRAVAGVFGDLALDDVDDRGPVAVAVPRHDATGHDLE